MRATRAYIASAGTASVMLGAAVAMLALVSAFVAFGSWPGSTSATQVDEILLAQVAKPKAQKVAVGAAAVRAERRAEARRQVALARAERRVESHDGGARTPRASTPAGTAAPTTAAGTP